MGRNQKLASEKPRRIPEKLHQFLLPFRRQAVFRFIQQIKAIFFYFLMRNIKAKVK